MTSPPRIVVLDGYRAQPGDLSWDDLQSLGTAEIYDRTAPDEVHDRAKDADILITNKTVLSREQLTELPRCAFISVLATGVDVVDVQAAREFGIAVSNVPAYSTYEVAQYTIAMILTLCHRIETHHQAVQVGEWNRQGDFSFWLTPQSGLANKTLAILGLGKIGQQVGRIASALGMNILAAGTEKNTDPADYPLKRCSMEDCLSQADILSLHLPLTEKTRHIIQGETIKLMKPSAWIINTSRGGLIDEVALRDALQTHRLGAAALDVVSQEPIPKDHPLLGLSNCIITPHMAWASREARVRLLRITTENIQSFLSGSPINVVN